MYCCPISSDGSLSYTNFSHSKLHRFREDKANKNRLDFLKSIHRLIIYSDQMEFHTWNSFYFSAIVENIFIWLNFQNPRPDQHTSFLQLLAQS